MIPGWCNGSTSGSGPLGLGSNPSPGEKNVFFLYITVKRKTIKRYKPKRKLKISLKYTNGFIIFLSYSFLIIFMFFFIIKNYSSNINFKNISITTNTINKISLNTNDNLLKYEIYSISSKWLSKIYSKEILNSLENEIKKIYPYTKISHSFNPITGNLSLKISKIPAIAKLKDEEKYLLENMVISPKNPDPNLKNYPIIKINQNINKQSFDLLKKIISSELSHLFESNPIIYIEEKNFLIEYDNGIKILLSDDFKLKETNITKIKNVIKDAKNKTSSFIIDARYIEYGKLIVKPI